MSERTKRPAYQWYPGDWRRDVALQACSWEARALWRDMLDLMFDGQPYGHLTAGAVAIEPTEIGRILGLATKRVSRYLAELEVRSVFSRTEAGVIYSRRMVRDERVRTVRAESGALGGNPSLLRKDKHEVNPPDNHRAKQKPTPAVAVAVASAVAGSTPPTNQPAREALLTRFGAREAEPVAAFLAEALTAGRPEVRWVHEIGGWLDGLAMPPGVLPSPTDVAGALADYLLTPARDFSPVHVRAFVPRWIRAQENGANAAGHAIDPFLAAAEQLEREVAGG